ncbi:MAG: DUF6602 domain-containing protein [Candidatus Kapaibacterium sp.]
MLYDDYVLKLTSKIIKKFDDISTEYNFDLGPEFEIALCKILRDFLPNKYGICRGFVVSASGEKAGDDIIIYDRDRFPTLRLLEQDNFEIKEQIPIEAVYAYIEAKHSLTIEAFTKSMSQIIEAKKLCKKRDKRKLYQTDPYFDTDLRPPYQIEHLPDYRNPIFTMIFSRYGLKNTSTNTEEIDEFLRGELDKINTQESEFFPELIVAGNNNFMSTAYKKDGINKPTLFHLFERDNSGYQVVKSESIAFGIAFAHLIAAIDWIRLGKMPWENIINESKHFDTSKLEIPINQNKPLEINFTSSDFKDKSLTVKHDKGYKPQVTILDENEEIVLTDIKITNYEVVVSVGHSGFNGKLLIS